MDQYYQSLQETKAAPVIAENTKKSIESTIQKIFYREKDTYETTLLEAKQFEGKWVEKRTAEGIFYYNAQQDVWMNTFGVIKKTLQELLLFTVGYDGDGKTSTTQPVGPTGPVYINPQSYFSDDGSKLALYAYDDAINESTIRVYDIAYSPTLTTTLLDEVSLGAVPFTAQSNEKCFVSDDGVHLITSCPTSQSVYLFDVAQNSLLQTITEDQPLFGSLIAVDKDFYSMAISSTSLNRSSSIYDTRAVSWGACSIASFYKRNFKSSSAQKFKKIHSNNAYVVGKKSGINKESYNMFSPAFPSPRYNDLAKGCDVAQEAGVYRFDDLKCKKSNFAISSVALKQDQIDYKSCFPNVDSPRYLSPTLPGFTYDSTQSSYSQQIATIYTAFYEELDPNPTDAQVIPTFTMTTLPSVKQFGIVRELTTNNFYEDSSYLQFVPVAPVLQFVNIQSTTQFPNPEGNTYFNTNIKGSFAEKGFIRGIGELRLTNEENFNLKPIFDEYTLNTKIGINDTHTYHVSQTLTGTAASYIKNIRIYRTYNTNEDGTESFSYQDYKKTGINTLAVASPPIDNTGLIKILYKTSDATLLESTFLESSTLSNSPSTVATSKVRLGILASKPYLANPTNCPNSEFAYPTSSDFIDDILQNIFVSSDYVFLNFTNKTMVFSINNSLSYKPLIFVASLNQSLYTYKFTYNNSGNYFAINNTIYQYDTVSNTLILKTTI
jgi:hypothetical protein